MSDRDIKDSSDNKKDVGSEADDKLHEVASEVAAAARAVVASVQSQGIVQSVINWEHLWQDFWTSLPKQTSAEKQSDTEKLATQQFNEKNWQDTESMHKQTDVRIVAFQHINMDVKKSAQAALTNMQMSESTPSRGS